MVAVLDWERQQLYRDVPKPGFRRHASDTLHNDSEHHDPTLHRRISFSVLLLLERKEIHLQQGSPTMKDERLKSGRGFMDAMHCSNPTHHCRHRKPALAALALSGAVVLLSPHAHSQNAAQLSALARLSHAHSQAVPTSGAEATTISLDSPNGLAFDSTGNLFIADTADNIVLEVNLAGAVSTVAGNGVQGSAGDAGAATSAQLDTPTGVAVDANGNIYVADSHNNRIRKVSEGTITTIAGNGTPGFSGDDGPAASAMLDRPVGVCVDAQGNIYIADTNNNRIREIAAGVISTVAGNGQQMFAGDGGKATAAALDSPIGVAVDGNLNIYIGDTHNQRVRMVNVSSGIISTIAGTGIKGFTSDGPALSAAMANPSGVWVDSTGTVYVADADNHRIRTISGTSVATIAGSGVQGYSGDAGAATTASLNTPRAVTATGNSVFFSDTLNNRVREVNSGAVNTTGGQPAPSSESLVIGGAVSAVYGTGIGTLTATFSNGGQTGTGLVTFYDGIGANPVAIGSAALSGNTASISAGSLTGGTHDLVASYAGDAKNAAIVSGVYVFVVTKAPTITTLAASSTTPVLGTSATLTATVASTTSGTPTGAVTFFNGSAPLNTTPVALTGGVATLNVTTLPVGAINLTAAYSGDTNFTPSTSSAVTGSVVSPDFAVAATPATQSVLPTHSVSYAITVTPTNPTFIYPVTLSASGVPNGVTATFTPSSTIASGSVASTVQLTLSTTGSARMEHQGPFRSNGPLTALALLFLPFALNRRFRSSCARISSKPRLLASLLALAVVATLSGCGGGGFFSHSTQSYTVTVTAIGGPDTHTTTVTLNVQ